MARKEKQLRFRLANDDELVPVKCIERRFPVGREDRTERRKAIFAAVLPLGTRVAKRLFLGETKRARKQRLTFFA